MEDYEGRKETLQSGLSKVQPTASKSATDGISLGLWYLIRSG